MLFEFALLPDVIEETITSPHETDQLHVVNLLERLRENGMLVDLRDGDWRNHVYDLLTQSSRGYLNDIIARLKELDYRNRIVSHPSSPGSGPTDWIAEANSARVRCIFDGVILSHSSCGRLTKPPSHYFPFPSPPFPSAAWTEWQGKRSIKLGKCEADFRAALTPVLRHASKVDLVDPYFNCHRAEYRKTLCLCVDLLMRGTASHPQLVIHAGDPQKDWRRHNSELPRDRKNAWNAYLLSLYLPRSITFQVFLWGEMPPERPHNRYIFTDQHVGISVPDGLACYHPSDGRKDSWDLKDVDVAWNLLTDYTSVPIYNLLGHVKITK